MANTLMVGVKCKSQFACDFPGCSKVYTSEAFLARHLPMHSEENVPPANFEGWKQHYKYRHIFGLPDGRVWSCTIGRFLEGTKLNGYIQLRIDGKSIDRHRLNFEIVAGRAIRPGMHIDHIKVPPKLEGTEQLPKDDSWSNLQELTLKEHCLKTLMDNPGKGKKGGITKGFPVVVLHVASGEETRYDSLIDAAFALGVDRKTITKRLNQNSSKELRGYVFRQCPEHLVKQADQPGEIWKDAIFRGELVKGVRVSNMGRVQLRKGTRTEGGILNDRLTVGIRINNKDVGPGVHLVIAHTFIGPPPSPEHTVDHKDGDSMNNHLTNLRWATKEDQARNMTTNRAVRKYDLEGNLLKTYGTITEAAEANSLSRWRVKDAAETGKRTTGFRWEFTQRKIFASKAT